MDFLLNFWTLKWLHSTLSLVEIRWTLVQFGQSFLSFLVSEVPLPSEKGAWPPNCPTTKRPDRTNAVRTNSPCSSPALSTWRLASWETQRFAHAYVKSCNKQGLPTNHFQRSDSGRSWRGLERFKYSCRVELMLWVSCTLTLELENIAGNLLVMLLYWYLFTKIRPCLGGLVALFDLQYSLHVDFPRPPNDPKTSHWKRQKTPKRYMSRSQLQHRNIFRASRIKAMALGGASIPCKKSVLLCLKASCIWLAMTEKEAPLYSEQHSTRSSSFV